MTKTIPQLILRYARQLLNKESDIDGEEQVQTSAEVCVKSVEAIEVQKRLDVWEAPEDILPCKNSHRTFCTIWVRTSARKNYSAW